MLDNPPGDDPVITLTARIVAAYVTKHKLPADQLPGLIGQTREALGSLAQTAPTPAEPEKPTPAVPVRKSIHNDYLVSLEDGHRYKTLKRHLMHKYGMTPDQYREKWGLPADYPMVAPGYSARRSELAKDLGLGNKRTRSPSNSDRDA
ncbi:MucR family transcriptional regulator [Rhizobium sp. PP-F2F-G36]|nr:MucR family transcriptional regulator [Rhizobium sp. PP-CC-2G-626]TCQ03323.1 MucR family transcriptional regulator [Rhizobium sp. PP-F2F-G36]